MTRTDRSGAAPRMSRPGARRRVRMATAVALVAISTAVTAGCGSDGASDALVASTDRSAAVIALVDDVVVPAYIRAADDAAALDDAVRSLCAAPSADALTGARRALATAWAGWEVTDSFDIGPVMERRSASVVSYRVDAPKVDATLATAPPLDPETVRNRTAASLRGFGAANHLLSGAAAGSPPTDDPTVFADPARCGYLTAVVDVIADETSLVATGWTDGADGAPPFRDLATGTGDDALEPTEVIDALVNMQTSLLEAETKLLTAVVDAGTATPIELPAAALFQLAAQVDGISRVYAPLGRLLDGALGSRVTDAAARVTELLGAEATTPSEAQPTKALVTGVVGAVDDLRLTIGTEVVSALDVTVSFSENDGDS